MQNLLPLLLPGILVVVYFAMLLGVVTFQRWRRKSRWPFPVGDKLLRGPGEDLKRRIAEIDEAMPGEMIFAICGGILALSGGVYLLKDIAHRSAGTSLAFGFGLLAVIFGVSGWRFVRLWEQRQNCVLGWFGERYVAEWLEPAKLQGWRIFHDVPFENNGAKFNIDHVVVGLGGVFALETKTRRKGRARPGFKDNAVLFDGRNLVWPWAEDTHGLDQAERNSRSLAEWIHHETNERVHVAAVLVLPGWWLENQPGRNARFCEVQNPKWLPGFFSRQRPLLTAKQIEFISGKLEARCRDVEA